MTLGPGDLILCSGTLPPGAGFTERLEAAAGAGVPGISLWGRDYGRALAEGLTDNDIPHVLADHGLSVGELDPAWWWLPGAAATGASIPPSYDEQGIFTYGEDEVFRIAGVVGARSINAVDVFGGSWGTDDAAEAFASLCDRAADRGLLVHLEFLPWTKVPDLPTAWDVVQRAGRPNGGIAVDAWHFARSGSDLATLRSIPGEHILGIQLDDGPVTPEPDLVTATLHDRLVPGEGGMDVVALVATLIEIGAAAPFGIEVFSDSLHALGARQAAERAVEATRKVVAAGAAIAHPQT